MDSESGDGSMEAKVRSAISLLFVTIVTCMLTTLLCRFSVRFMVPPLVCSYHSLVGYDMVCYKYCDFPLLFLPTCRFVSQVSHSFLDELDGLGQRIR